MQYYWSGKSSLDCLEVRVKCYFFRISQGRNRFLEKLPQKSEYQECVVVDITPREVSSCATSSCRVWKANRAMYTSRNGRQYLERHHFMEQIKEGDKSDKLFYLLSNFCHWFDLCIICICILSIQNNSSPLPGLKHIRIFKDTKMRKTQLNLHPV